MKEPNEKLAVETGNGRCRVSEGESSGQQRRRKVSEEPSRQERCRKVSKEPFRQNSSRSHSSRHGSSKRHPRSEEHRCPKVSSSNSSRCPASSSYTSRDDYIDSHCHLDRLYSRHQFRGCLGAFLWKYSPGYNPNFLGCVTNFCDPVYAGQQIRVQGDPGVQASGRYHWLASINGKTAR